MSMTKNLKNAGRRLTTFLLTAILLLALLPVVASAADLPVTNEADLRAAVAAAGSADTIVLMNDITLTSPLVITRNCSLTFTSVTSSARRTIFAPNSRHFLLSDNLSVTLNLGGAILNGQQTGGGIEAGSLKGGTYSRVSGVILTLNGAQIERCFSAGNGAALSVVGINNTVTLNNCAFADNALTGSATISRAGGAVYVDGAPLWPWENYTGSLSVNNCSFNANKAGAMGTGGAVACVGVQMTTTNASLNGNTAENAGGAVFFSAPNTSAAAKLLVQSGSMNNNRASMGGAIAVNMLNKPEVRGNTVFSGNAAAEGRLMTDAADIALHNAQVDSTVTPSQGYTYLYNNCDVLYLKGTFVPIEPPTGVRVTGSVKSYNPNNPVKLELKQGSTLVKTAVIAAGTGSGQHAQSFAFDGVEPGTYSLVITKDAHTSFTVETVVVSSSNLDLTIDSRDAVKEMVMLCGDISGDDMINDGDLAILWLAANYNKGIGDPGVNKLCDLNGDGMINDGDLAILWLAVNYNKGDVIVP